MTQLQVKRIGPEYADGTVRCLLRHGATVVSAAVAPNGTIEACDDWPTLVGWSANDVRLIGRQFYGPSTYGHERYFLREPVPQPWLGSRV